MLDFFKRLFGSSQAASQAPKPAQVPRAALKKPKPARPAPAPLLEPPAMPEVQDSDWAAWENSVLEHDSQMQSLEPATPVRRSRVKADEGSPTPPDVDPFAHVTKNTS